MECNGEWRVYAGLLAIVMGIRRVLGCLCLCLWMEVHGVSKYSIPYCLYKTHINT